ncbi:flagellar basal-body rod protein FlgG [Elstera cyanobacteriorum]|uniref:Flagellar basal-body rod protein FlgG n=1 Tax=Elstera cyanobacteriorum TaxID=2022747 RepID=A0A255XP96_9PROT|nr:flagellar basal-body rod protein FlgG [Elstera cyanobacteriorum]MCK6442170.1 flagellar basal-body rod protein FlgG [Elstera cyanobacteriorum]OYQ18803.1 flagellar basal-body rod protein FlgG [Elstera cyanobacteriorum]GFZ77596.1 flagellar basal-body rod protein FlgG [Elstera cyanobacteriorum]
MRSLNIGATGMLAQQLNVEVISNNIANLNTTGFKRSRAEFQDLLYQNERRVGSTSSDAGTTIPSGIQVGLGVRTAAVYRMHEQGNIQPTNNPLDIAVQGQGYFAVDLPTNEIAYTRAGSFQLNENGQIVTPDGYQLRGPGQIPQNAQSITINSSGEVLVKVPGQTQAQNVGQINLTTFVNEAGLQATGQNLFMQTQASGEPDEGVPGVEQRGTILQGFLETSNVNIVSEITNLITAQRAYEMNSRVIETSDQMMSTLTQMR